jgi:hypothetical protein
MPGLGYKRGDLQAIAEAKLDDAALLLRNNRFSNAYYLAGYAVEIGLKACIAKQIVAEVIPPKDFVNSIYQHSFKALIGAAGLRAELEKEQDSNPGFAGSWAIVSNWSEQTRYEIIDPTTAQVFLVAVVDPTFGVFRWIKAFW